MNTTDKNLISVVTVCRNVRADLEKTMRSVLSQTYSDIEYIIVDGNSSDGTRELLESIDDPRVRWISERDKGIYDAMKKGTRMASGEWVIFMNAGDAFMDSEVIGKAAGEIRELKPDADVAYGDVVKNGVVKKAEEPRNTHRMFFCHQCAFNRRSALLRHPFDPAHPLSADFKFYKTLVREGRGFHRMDFPIADFDTSGVSNRRRSAGLADNMKVIREVDGLFHGMPFLLHLFPTYLIAKLRGK